MSKITSRKLAALTVMLLFMTFTVAATASDVTFSPVSLSADDVNFLNGAFTSTSGNSLTVFLPNYGTSNFDSSIANQVGIGLNVSALAGLTIQSVTYTFNGTFSGLGSSNFTQTGNAFGNSGNFTTSPYSGTFLFNGAVSTVNLDTLLNLDDAGDSAQVSSVTFTVGVAEPISIALLGSGLGALGIWRRKRS